MSSIMDKGYEIDDVNGCDTRDINAQNVSVYCRDCVVPYVRHFHAGYGIFHYDSMKYVIMLQAPKWDIQYLNRCRQK